MANSGDIDFATLAAELLSDAIVLVPKWLPHGKFDKREYVALNPTRTDKTLGSFRINLDTGAWADFAISGAKGGDLIALRAYLDGSTQIEAAKRLLENLQTTPVERRDQTPRLPQKPKRAQILPSS